MQRNIKTQYVNPPIPSRSFDWMAWDDNTYDGAPDSITRNQIGHGQTEQAAIADLMEHFEQHENGCDCESCTYEERAKGNIRPHPRKGDV